MEVETKRIEMSLPTHNTHRKKHGVNAAYLGGLASMCATAITHPLDTVKVQLQTQKVATLGFYGMSKFTFQTNGVLAFYNGLSAALLRQATYSTVRFAFYEIAKTHLNARTKKEITFGQKMLLAGVGGALGSLVGTPFDLINVRMQNDAKLPMASRRNYKNAFDALYRIARYEGPLVLYTGFHMATLRGVVVTVGQLAVYDELKARLLRTGYMGDNIGTHLTAAMGAGLIATFTTMPLDVLKTLLMNAKPGELQGLAHVTRQVAQYGIKGFFKGFWPRYIRLGPFTLLTFIFYEQFRLLSKRIQF